MPGSKYFLEKQQKSLNSLVNDDGGNKWNPDSKYLLEASDAIGRAKYELNYGILTKFQQLRMKQLEARAATECYGNFKLSYLEAEECEAFVYKNDYKMK